jgi:hypothetical protein
MRPTIIRTPESSILIEQLAMARHDPMQALHNVLPNDARYLVEGHHRVRPASAAKAHESHHPRAGSEGGAALGAESHPKLLVDGYCGTALRLTQDEMHDACAFRDSGSWSLSGNLSTDVFGAGAMDMAHAVCAALCAECERCAVISFSVLHKDVRRAPRVCSMPSHPFRC